MAEKYKYKAFISYSHSDEKWASWLHKSLETYKVPKTIVGRETRMGEIPARLMPVFRDRDELPSATNLGELLTESLRASATLIVICSPDAVKSQWVNEEIVTFKRLGRSHRIFCLIVDGEPWASNKPEREHEECFPRALRYELGDDLELSDVQAEPIAADARLEGDGKINARLKLISGMLGVGFDALKQREANRRHRRMLAFTTAAFVGMAITSGLAVTAYMARLEAEEQRNRAQIEAETAKQTTDFMVGLFSVSDPSEALGNTITAREILDKGAVRIDTELVDQPEIQATLMDTMGSVYQSLGLYPEASDLLKNALDKRLRELGSESTLVAQTQGHLAEVLSLLADYESAEPMYRDALSTQRRVLGESAPEIAKTLTGLADLMTMDGRYDEAEPLFRESLAIRQQIDGGDSLEVAEGIEYLGMNLYDQGEYPAAEAMLRESNAMRRRILKSSPHPQLADGLNNEALIYWTEGRLEEAEKLFRDALAMSRVLLEEDHPTITVNLNNLAMVIQDSGDFDSPEPMFREVIDSRKRTLGDRHPGVALALNNLAYLYYDRGEREPAIVLQRESVDMFRDVFPDGHPDLAISLGLLGHWLTNDGYYAEADAVLHEAVEMGTSTLGEDRYQVAKAGVSLAQLYLETDRTEAAAETAARAREVFAGELGEDHWRTAWAASVQSAALVRLGRYDEAEPILLSSRDTLRSEPDSGSMKIYVQKTNGYLADLYRDWGKPDEAAKYVAMRGRSEHP